LVLTDFSNNADHASQYALKLAHTTKANLLLCNMFLVPYVEPMTTQIAWPTENYNSIEEDSKHGLNILAERLKTEAEKDFSKYGFKPDIEVCSKSGSIADILKELAEQYDLVMAVIGQHDSNVPGLFLSEDHARKIIEKADFPVLIIPENFPFANYKKIAFATDLSISDIDILHSLSGLARLIDSEILITHVDDDSLEDEDTKKNVRNFFNMVSSEINYPKLFLRAIKSNSVTTGLDWLAQNDEIDLLVLVHRKRNFLRRLFDGSVTHKMASHIEKPLLIFSGSKVHENLLV